MNQMITHTKMFDKIICYISRCQKHSYVAPFFPSLLNIFTVQKKLFTSPKFIMDSMYLQYITTTGIASAPFKCNGVSPNVRMIFIQHYVVISVYGSSLSEFLDLLMEFSVGIYTFIQSIINLLTNSWTKMLYR